MRTCLPSKVKFISITFLFLLIGLTPLMAGAQTTEIYTSVENQSSLFSHTDSQDRFYKTEINKKINLELKNVSLRKALKEIAMKTGFRLTYRGDIVNGERITLITNDISVSDALSLVLEGTGLEYLVSREGYLLISPIEMNEELLFQETVTGQVTDASTNESLPGVNIVVKGTTIGTSTNLDGNFTLDNVPSLNDTLVVSFVGYTRQEIPINGRETINIALQPLVFTGDELVVTGYSSQREADITGSVSVVNVRQMNNATSSASALQKLSGQVSGVQVESNGSPGSISTVRIRGVSSFGNNDPLYIIDGNPVQGNFLNFINPNDIESMQVLKDASAASIYGARANNGVVIIETRKGQATGGVQASFNAKFGINTPVGKYSDDLIQDALTYHEVVKRSNENAGQEVPRNIYGDPNNPTIPDFIWPMTDAGARQTTANDVDVSSASFPDNLIMPGSAGTDWWGALFDPAFVQDYNLGISGGNESAVYNVSFGFLDQDGTMRENFYKRGTARINTQFNVGRFKFGENVTFVADQTAGGMQQGTMGENTPIGNLIKMQPVVPIRDVQGNFAGPKANGLGNGANPVAQAERAQNNVTETNRFVGNIFGTADILENLVFRTDFSFNVGRSTSQNFFFPTFEESEPNTINSFNESANNFTNWTFTNTLAYNLNLGTNHEIDVLGGTEILRDNSRGFFASQSGFLSTDVDVRFINDEVANPGSRNITTFGSFGTLASFFGKVDYSYADKYLLSVTVRRDGSSRLGDTWGTFPALSVGWRISDEPFMQESDLITDLKLRFGFGITGNQQIPSGRIVNQFGGGIGEVFADIDGDGDVEQGFKLADKGNEDLRWEENTSYNAGFDAAFLDGKVDFVLDLWLRNTDDLLFDPRTPATVGQSNPPFVNVGRMQNRGLDFSFGINGSSGTDVTWNVDVIGSHYKNEIKTVTTGQDFFFGPVTGRQGVLNINQVGSPIGSFFGLVTDGIFANQAEVDAHVTQDGAAPGRFRFKDVNGDGVISGEDRTTIGNPHPVFTGGVNLGVQWKNFDFSTFLFASIGNDIFDLTKEFTVFRLFNTNVREEILSRSAVVENGQVVNIDDAVFPRIDLSDNFSNVYSDFYVEDASYLRVRNLEVGYNVPAGDVIPGIRNARVYLQAQNVFTITGYDNIDPALPANQANRNGVNVSDQGRGIDRGTFPNNRSFNIGIDINF